MSAGSHLDMDRRSYRGARVAARGAEKPGAGTSQGRPMPKKIVATAAFVALFPATSASAGSDRTADTHCRRYANTARLVTRALHRPLFATTLSTTWCYDGQHVVRLAGVRIVPT